MFNSLIDKLKQVKLNNFNNILYLSRISKILLFQPMINIKLLLTLHSFLTTKSSKIQYVFYTYSTYQF